MRRFLLALALWGTAQAQVVLPFWHTAGPPGDRVLLEAVRSFNESQKPTA